MSDINQPARRSLQAPLSTWITLMFVVGGAGYFDIELWNDFVGDVATARLLWPQIALVGIIETTFIAGLGFLLWARVRQNEARGSARKARQLSLLTMVILALVAGALLMRNVVPHRTFSTVGAHDSGIQTLGWPMAASKRFFYSGNRVDSVDENSHQFCGSAFVDLMTALGILVCIGFICERIVRRREQH